MVTSQFIYLLLESNENTAAHEIQNLERMFVLLSTIPRFKKKWNIPYSAIVEALSKKTPNYPKGLKIEPEKIEDWKVKLKNIA